jgi:nitrite reductase/ring-hydroxylating ferredoxin subunit
MAKKYKWHKLSADPAGIKWTRGHVADTEFEVAGKQLCLGRFEDEWFAFAASCPHAGAPMTQAYITCPAGPGGSANSALPTTPDPAASKSIPTGSPSSASPKSPAATPSPTNCHISCPVHGLRFNLRNGRDTNGEGYSLRIYPVELREDGLYIGIEEGGGLFKWF